MELLSYKIRESFGQFPEYQNLEGLTATNLTKMDEEKKILPTEGKVGDFLGNGDIIYLDLISNEIWIKVTITLSNVINKKSQLNVSMDIKVKNELTFRELRYKILKFGIMCFSDNFKKSDLQYHYIISEYSISTPTHGNIEDNKLRTIDDMKIKQLFTFKNNMKIGIKFYPLEFVLFQKLKAISISKKEKPPKRKILEKFKFLKFRELLINKRYKSEKDFIFNYIKNLLKNEIILSKCYIYSFFDNTKSDIIDDNYEDNKKEEDKDCSFQNAINGLEEDNIDFDISGRKKSLGQFNNSLSKSSFNKTSKVLAESSGSYLLEDSKCNLIIIPQKKEDDEKAMNNFKNKNYQSTKILDLSENDDINFNELIKSDNKDFYVRKNIRKKSDKMNPKVGTSGVLDFEIIEKEDLLEKDDDMFIYKDLRPKELIKKKKLYGKNNYKDSDLCDDFEKYLQKINFINFICGLYLMNIQKGALEKCTLPHLRGYKVTEKKIMSNNKKKKKKKIKDSVSYYNQIFPLKRLNCELSIFSIFIFGILIFLSYLISNTYY
jgi:hypothetical protein